MSRDIYDDCAQDLQVIVSDVDNIGKLLDENGVPDVRVHACRARIDSAVTRLSMKLRNHVEGSFPEPPPISESEAIRRATLAAMNPEAAIAEERARASARRARQEAAYAACICGPADICSVCREVKRQATSPVNTEDDDPGNMLARAGWLLSLAGRLDGEHPEMVRRSARSLLYAAGALQQTSPTDEWRKVATNRRHRIAELEAEIEKLKIIAEATKAYIESEDQDRVEEFDDMEAAVKDYYKPEGA